MDRDNSGNIVGHIAQRKEVSIGKGLHNCFGFDISFIKESGSVTVTKIVPGFPAEKVLTTKDVITNINGVDVSKFVNKAKMFAKFMRQCKQLDILFLSIVRTEEIITIIDEEEDASLIETQ